MMNKLQEQAISTLETIIDRHEKYTELNDLSTNLNPDFPSYIRMIDDEIETSLFVLLDEILENIASYFYYECLSMQEGGAITENGIEYKLKTIDDFKDYLNRSKNA